MKIKIVLIATIFVALLQSCKQNQEVKADADPVSDWPQNIVQLTEAQYKNANLSVVSPEIMKIAHVITLNGKLEMMPENMITISSPMAGFVRQLKLIPGMNVAKGQLLFQMEEKEYIQLQQDFLTAKNAFSFAKLDYERQAELSKSQAVSDKAMQAAEEKMRSNQILMRSLGEKLKLLHINPVTLSTENLTSQIAITAPSSGTITEVLVNSGKYVQAGDDMIRMNTSNGTKLILKAFEKDLPYIKIGQAIVAYTNADPTKKIRGNISYVVNQVNTEGFAQIVCHLDQKNEQLLPGMYLNADIEAESIQGWAVADESIITYEGKEYVFLEKGNQAYEMVEIKSGQRENGMTQVINFQNFSDRKVVSKGAYTLLMKMKNVSDE